MYSQSENLCNKKLVFVSLAQNFASCLISCVAPFHFLLLSWLETALLFRFSFYYFLSLISMFYSPFLHCFFVTCFSLFYSIIYPFFCIRHKHSACLRYSHRYLVPGTETARLLFVSNNVLTCSVMQNTG